jgi:hypothetical protein
MIVLHATARAFLPSMGSIFDVDVNVCKKAEGPWGDDIGPLPDEAKANAKFLVGARELTPTMIDLLEKIDQDLERVTSMTFRESELSSARDLIEEIQRSIRDL